MKHLSFKEQNERRMMGSGEMALSHTGWGSTDRQREEERHGTGKRTGMKMCVHMCQLHMGKVARCTENMY